MRLPAGVVCAVAVVAFLSTGVTARDLAVFAAYLGVGVMLPGTLLWRALTGGRAPGGLAAGLAFGYAVEVLAYIPARAAGMPMLVLVPPAAVLAAFACVPGLRRHWRGDAGRDRMPVWCAWTVAAIVGYLVVWSTLFLYRVPVARAYVDMPYHLALVGELRRHVPPTLPSVLGEPLPYHWFVYAEMAATSRVTGIAPETLVYRLSTLPMAAATAVLVVLLGRRLGGSWGAGAAAAGVTYFLFGPVLVDGVVFSTRSMFTVWASPTQTFGALLFVPVVLLLGERTRGGWVALLVLLAALSGAKATYLPLLLAGLVLVVAVRGLVERRLPGAWLGAAAVTLGFLVFAQGVLFAGGSQGTVVAPFATVRQLWGAVAGVPTAELAPLVVLAGVHLFCLACVWGGVAGLGRRALEPSMLLVLGIGAAGVGAALLLGHPAGSQLYFLEGARPYLSIAAVCGVLAAARVSWARVAGTVGLGVGAALLVPVFGIGGGPLPRVVAPYAVLAALLVAVVVAARWRRGGTVAVAVALLAGYAAPSSAVEVAGHVLPLERSERLIPKGALAAARWLRRHSAPRDVVATDLHCLHPRWIECDSRHYWVSAFTQRRVLVEGWAYAESTLGRARLFGTPYLTLPYADPARLAANDAAFREPSAHNVRELAVKYGVKWLFTRINPELEVFARLRYRNAAFSVYEIPLDPADTRPAL
ncbi:hypothetical protein SAMN05421874_118103 [Nonomuraea maritima]|uniref:4-amino-4-deoxy-L-arabinose transferase n=1 Tax=Nonomuraea maritima TaxID=683260 RepID=A0A1G9ILT5_9ACTN|nr:hypothetical protein [Nonomuraea maritima]SDL26122.1 hypothetical protein SAMN05421874_118103 [Nonomuraea maritima]